MYKALFINIFILIGICAAASPVRLYGSAPEYKRMAIELNKYADFITHEQLSVCVLNFDSLGNFDVTADVDDVTYAFADLGSIMAYFYIEPGCDYQLVLPPFKPRADVDRLNPYYKPELVEMGIANTTSRLNEAMRNFYLFADSIYNATAVLLAKTRNVRLADKVIAECDSVARLQNISNKYFDDYVRYTEARIFALAHIKSPNTVAKRYFLRDSVVFNQEIYWQTLDLVYNNFLTSSLRGKSLERVRQVLDNKSPNFTELSSAIATDSAFSQLTLREMLIVKGLYDGYYSGLIAQQTVDSLLVSCIHEAKTEVASISANNIYLRINRMRAGTLAPDFTLYDFDGNERKLSDFRGLFVYLSFQHSDNHACQKDFPALSAIDKKYTRLMYVVTIFTDDDMQKAMAAMKRGKYKWLQLSAVADPSVALRYGVTHQPTYFLIDPEGRLALSPAHAPTDSRNQISISQQMQRYKAEKMRRTPPQTRDIYQMVREVKNNSIW